MTSFSCSIIRAASIAMACAWLVGCGGDTEPSSTIETITPQEAIAASLAHPDRFAGDARDDALRKPAEVLAFSGVEPGMDIFEVEAGHGYYTELLSRIVGPTGSIVMQNPPSFDSFTRSAVTKRLADNRLPNVRLHKSKFDKLDAADNSMDMVTWFLGPHEVYWRPAGVDTLGDDTNSYAEVFRILKPGADFIVLDHAAEPGAPKSTGHATHRIDPAIVKAYAGAAGFELVDQSDLLRNTTDRYELSVFRPEVRRKTDRFLIRFRKPE